MALITEFPMSLIIPFWFKQRQCKAEAQGDATLKVTGPNLPEAYLHVAVTDPTAWRAALRMTPDGPDLATADAVAPTAKAAWEAAFELYRIHFIV